MSTVTIAVNGRSYSIICDNGQEDHLRRLGQSLDKRVTELAAGLGQIGEARLLLLAALSALDELSDAYADQDASKTAVEEARRQARLELAAAKAALINETAAEIEALAARLEAEAPAS